MNHCPLYKCFNDFVNFVNVFCPDQPQQYQAVLSRPQIPLCDFMFAVIDYIAGGWIRLDHHGIFLFSTCFLVKQCLLSELITMLSQYIF